MRQERFGTSQTGERAHDAQLPAADSAQRRHDQADPGTPPVQGLYDPMPNSNQPRL